MTRRLRVWLGLLLVGVTFAVGLAAQDSVPPLIQVGGALTDHQGKPLAGRVDVAFALYKEQSDSAPLWVETQTVAADSMGRFVALLGATSATGLPLDLFSTGQARWLGMQAAGQPEQPRTFLASVPYALAPLSALSSVSNASTNPASGPTTDVQRSPSSALQTTSSTLSFNGPPSPVFTIVTDSTSGLKSTPSDNNATVTLTLINTCSTGQLLKWNGTSWGCTSDTDVKIGVTGGGLNVLANATSPNIVGGFSGNAVTNGAAGATIGGGGERNLNGALCPAGAICAGNRVTQSFGTVGGGENNQAGSSVGTPTVASFATVGGGQSNIASGQYSAVLGGLQNAAAGSFSFAAGRSAKANHDGSFVWADNSSANQTASTAPNQFLIRAAGGVGIGTTAPTTMLDVRGHLNLQDSGNNGVLAFPSGGGLFFRSGVDNVSYADRMFISGATGRVGIGTATPAHALDVVGNVRADQLCIGTDCRNAWPSGSGGGLSGIGGTASHLAKWADGTTLVSSSIVEDAQNVVITDRFGNRAFAVESSFGTPNIIGGWNENAVASGVSGAVIAGGGERGIPNQVLASFGSVGGGLANTVGRVGGSTLDGQGGVIGGGFTNSASGSIATVAGGSLNIASGEEAFVGGGTQNVAGDRLATVSGGGQNQSNSRGATVGGGQHNVASSPFATVPGGAFNTASGVASFAAGNNATALHEGTFVWASGNTGTFVSTGDYQFLIRASGGVGIGTNSPSKALDVAGDIKADGLCIGTDCRIEWPAGGGTVTSISAGAGLSASASNPITTNGTLSIATGGITNAMLQSSSVTLNAGAGLSGGGTVALGGSSAPLRVDFAATQQRVTGSCPSGFAIKAVDQQGAVDCEPVVTTGLTGTGSVNVLTKFVAQGALGSTAISDDGTNVVIGLNGGGVRVLGTNGAAPNIVGGFAENSVSNGVIGGTIAGGGFYGFPNTITGGVGSIGGGYGNSADIAGTVAGGSLNRAFQAAAVGGGEQNVASGNVATIPGGLGNVAAGAYSFAAGFYAKANDEGAFVWADPEVDSLSLQAIPFSSTRPNQFLIRASGGVGIGTNVVDPAVAALTVAGRVKSDGLCLGSDCRSAWPSGSGGITGVTALSGLSGGGTSGNVSLGIAIGGVTNAMLQNSSLTVNAGSGLAGGGTIALGGSAAPLSVDFTTTQKRLSNNCAGATAIQSVSENGSVICVPVGGMGGSGTQDTIPKFLTGGTTVGNSRIVDDGTNLTFGDATGLLRMFGNPTSPNLVGGFKDNAAIGPLGTVVGATVSGGGTTNATNRVTSDFGVVAGGQNNQAGSINASLNSRWATVSGGISNQATGPKAAVGGGEFNVASEQWTTVSGGEANTASGPATVVGGGSFNTASGTVATIPGGRANTAAGKVSFAAGNQAQALHDGAFVWADSTLTDFASTAPNQFLIRASGYVGINTPTPTEALDVNGSVKALKFIGDGSLLTNLPSSGGGTLTGVTAGGGLTGGGTSGTVSLGIATGGVTNAMLQNSSVTVNTGLGLTGGGSVALGGTPGTFAIDTTVVPRLTTANTFTAQQNVNIAVLTPAITGVNTAAAGAGFGVLGRSSSTTGRGVFGDATASSGVNYGVYGQTASPGIGAAGVFGIATSATGSNVGVFGTSASTTGSGISGQATASTGNTTGGNFQVVSPSGTGVFSQGGNFGVQSFGVGTGVFAEATSTTGVTYGVNGISQSSGGTGVRGTVTATSGVNYGVYGSSSSPNGYGVYSQGNAYVLGNAHIEGNLSYSGSLTQSSSRRWKTNIVPMTDALGKVQRLQGVTYDWKSTGRHDFGLIAEDVHVIVPEVVVMEENGVDAKGVDYARLTALLIEAVKEQQAQIRQLQATVDELSKRIGSDRERVTKR